MKALLIFAAAASFDATATSEIWQEAHDICVSGENHDGEPVALADWQKACDDQISLAISLKENGYCQDDQGQFGWSVCK